MMGKMVRKLCSACYNFVTVFQTLLLSRKAHWMCRTSRLIPAFSSGVLPWSVLFVLSLCILLCMEVHEPLCSESSQFLLLQIRLLCNSPVSASLWRLTKQIITRKINKREWKWQDFFSFFFSFFRGMGWRDKNKWLAVLFVLYQTMVKDIYI